MLSFSSGFLLDGNAKRLLMAAASKSSRSWPEIGSICLAADLHLDFTAIDVDLYFGERIFQFTRPGPQGREHGADTCGRDFLGAEFGERPQPEQVRKGEGLRRRNQMLAFPTAELALGNGEQSEHFFSRVGLPGGGKRARTKFSNSSGYSAMVTLESAGALHRGCRLCAKLLRADIALLL